MLIRDYMTHPVQTVRPLDSIRHARSIMEDRRVNQLPVIVGGRVVGIVTDRDLRDAFPSVFDAAAGSWAHRNSHADADPGIIPVEIVMTPHRQHVLKAFVQTEMSPAGIAPSMVCPTGVTAIGATA